jgi:hypothetical protein
MAVFRGIYLTDLTSPSNMGLKETPEAKDKTRPVDIQPGDPIFRFGVLLS